jgi:hypothetical protein
MHDEFPFCERRSSFTLRRAILRTLSSPTSAYFQCIMVAKSDPNSKLVVENWWAPFDFAIESDVRAGIMLLGCDVKSLRKGRSNLGESNASADQPRGIARSCGKAARIRIIRPIARKRLPVMATSVAFERLKRQPPAAP